MNRPIVTRRNGGEYSTINLGNVIETIFFGDDGSQRSVARTVLPNINTIHAQHIANDQEH